MVDNLLAMAELMETRIVYNSLTPLNATISAWHQ